MCLRHSQIFEMEYFVIEYIEYICWQAKTISDLLLSKQSFCFSFQILSFFLQTQTTSFLFSGVGKRFITDHYMEKFVLFSFKCQTCF